MKHLVIACATLLLFTAVISLSACGNTEDTTAATTAPAVTLSPEEEYLKAVDYLDFVLTGDDQPYFVGRWFEKEINGVSHTVTLTDGSHFYFMVEGAESFDVNFTAIHQKETPYFAYSIDGATPVRQKITDPTVTLSDSGKHTVRIIADGITESEAKWSGEIGFALRSIELSEGGRMIGIKPENKVVFFYGDSITEGIASLKAQYNSDGNSATNAYPWTMAKLLGVVPYYVGYGGSGLTREGSFNTCIRAIDYLSAKRKVDSSSIASVTPDLIVINHGHNDMNANISDTAYENGVRAVIQKLKTKYPDVPIVYVVPFAEKKNAAVQRQGEILDEIRGEYEDFYVIHTDTWTISFTDGTHPSAMGAKLAGNKLATELKKIFGEEFFQ